ncbi:hypothetical protein Pcinc_023724 [Petrolisthes cinctipes]|uniref:Ig-like domain-containing protein n=1 Tax=Petrolisthes cinctipes TaxID=88211 RepID=A0AAE1FBV5_PETCI|nr:hypothetical protein Pcinc_023724 [Petrolisthes cinctipes]
MVGEWMRSNEFRKVMWVVGEEQVFDEGEEEGGQTEVELKVRMKEEGWCMKNCHQCSQPVSAEVLAVVGQEVKLSCEVTGHPSPTLTWARPDQTRASSQSLGCRLWGQVTNPGGRLYREVEVVVEVPLRLTILPRTAEVTQGERFVVKCEAVGVPVPSINWLLNAVEVIGAQVVDEGEVIP